MEQRTKLIEERNRLSTEYFVKILKRSIDIDSKIRALVFKEPENMTPEIIAEVRFNEIFSEELERLEKEKAEIEDKRREVWKRILEINKILMSKR